MSGAPRSFQSGISSLSAFGIDDRAREDMRADLAALFEDADRNLAPGLGGELLQADRSGQAGRAGADDHDVIGHGFAFAHRSSRRAARARLPATALPFP